MRKALPTITESADELQRQMQHEPAGKKRQRWHALYLAASGQARYRQEIAALLGGPRHSVAARLEAYAKGGLAQARHSHVSTPPFHWRLTATALTARQAKLSDPIGFAGDEQMRVWLAEVQQVTLSYSSVHALVRYKRHAKPKRPRSAQAKKVRKLSGSFTLLCRPS